MKNSWSVSKDPIIAWRADLLSIRDQPGRLQTWLRAAINAGEREQVYTVDRAPRIDYLRERDGPLGPFLDIQYQATGQVNAYYFAFDWFLPFEGKFFRCRARMSYYDQAGNEVSGDVFDLCELWQKICPERRMNLRHRLPLDTGGRGTGLRDPKTGTKHWLPHTAVVNFTIYSDIWLPWHLVTRIRAFFRGMRRNPLASRHTPRLNRFLSHVGEVTRELGGKWEISDTWGKFWLFCADENGIRLDAPIPEDRQEVQVDDPEFEI